MDTTPAPRGALFHASFYLTCDEGHDIELTLKNMKSIPAFKPVPDTDALAEAIAIAPSVSGAVDMLRTIGATNVRLMTDDEIAAYIDAQADGAGDADDDED